MLLNKICAFLMSVLIALASAVATVYPQMVPEYDGITAPAAAPDTLPSYAAGIELLTLIADGASEYTMQMRTGIITISAFCETPKHWNGWALRRFLTAAAPCGTTRSASARQWRASPSAKATQSR